MMIRAHREDLCMARHGYLQVGENIVTADEFVHWPPYPLASRSARVPSSVSAAHRDDAMCWRALPRRKRSQWTAHLLPEPYPIERHGSRASVTHLFAAVSPSSPKFVALVVALYKLSVSLAPPLCYEPSTPSADPSRPPARKFTRFPKNRSGMPP
jgi:hypothetical protein